MNQDFNPNFASVTAETLGLPPISGGTKKQNEWASDLRDKALKYLWYHWLSHDDLAREGQKLPNDANWWIDNRTPGSNGSDTHEAARRLLGLRYQTPAGADY